MILSAIRFATQIVFFSDFPVNHALTAVALRGRRCSFNKLILFSSECKAHAKTFAIWAVEPEYMQIIMEK
jgi:hypothetical protein